ncbi:SGNH/GDSL hydrolase family protein [Pseudohoeflea coraliihabitans]|uniref:SGNH/GDSL hydrolase family protein n=1 Tax=Pseudohoeflea coraliihabitans TaxID=2860393 RepID=A0ABS6WK58_9HYPH|nr:SGNH/GDSL hydrolase family protein [Pseudohoeflea sp. DP4N28-3]MBW3096323.1 SGNH/GDSL hydrolase family protein [Pseudohoeflea sp. DP4N28-3]
MNTITAGLLSWLLLPVAAVYALGIRRTAPRLPPPRGPQRGRIGATEPVWRLLVMGDSSSAGVGAERVEDTLAPQLAHLIHATTGDAVSWRGAGANSAKAADIRDHVLPNIEERDFTHIVLTVGTNDMKNYLTARQFKKGFGGLLYTIHARWPDARVIWSPVLDMMDVPLLPGPLARILNMRVKVINTMGERLCRERQAIAAPPLPVPSGEGFASDGFHANAAGYRHWAEHLLPFLTDGSARQASLQQSGQPRFSTRLRGV